MSKEEQLLRLYRQQRTPPAGVVVEAPREQVERCRGKVRSVAGAWQATKGPEPGTDPADTKIQ